MRTTIITLAAATLLAACGTGEPAPTTAPDTVPPTTQAAPATDPAPATAPAEVVFDAQESDGTSIVVASVTLPAPGFVAVHGDGDGGPGPVIGHSALLPEGTSIDVVVALDEPLAGPATLYPMAHIDANANGEYEFLPPDLTVDGPARTADGGVAVVGAEVTVATGTAAPATIEIVISNFSFGEPVTARVGDTIVVRNDDGAGHTWTSDTGRFDSGSLGSGDEFTFTFEDPGVYTFSCAIHPSMTGTITVTG